MVPYENFIPMYSYLISEGRWNCFLGNAHRHIISQETCVLGNMLQNINTCKNGWTNFSANMRDVTLNLPELTQIASLNHKLSLTSYIRAIRLGDVIKKTRFLMRPPVVIHHAPKYAKVWIILVCIFCNLGLNPEDLSILS